MWIEGGEKGRWIKAGWRRNTGQKLIPVLHLISWENISSALIWFDKSYGKVTVKGKIEDGNTVAKVCDMIYHALQAACTSLISNLYIFSFALCCSFSLSDSASRVWGERGGKGDRGTENEGGREEGRKEDRKRMEGGTEEGRESMRGRESRNEGG
jgi:hypothetical protein